ncbi:MAG: DUF3465 domain-containing protein [Desulforhopalus sp.]
MRSRRSRHDENLLVKQGDLSSSLSKEPIMDSQANSFKNTLALLMLTGLLLAGYHYLRSTPQHDRASSQVMEAYLNRRSNIQVEGEGEVIKILKDDLKAPRHQRMIVQIDRKLTVLIAHNIDIAPRLDTLAPGDHLFFAGEYEWNKKGGVVHWTHHDPHRHHPDGWLKFKGKTYQ